MKRTLLTVVLVAWAGIAQAAQFAGLYGYDLNTDTRFLIDAKAGLTTEKTEFALQGNTLVYAGIRPDYTGTPDQLTMNDRVVYTFNMDTRQRSLLYSGYGTAFSTYNGDIAFQRYSGDTVDGLYLYSGGTETRLDNSAKQTAMTSYGTYWSNENGMSSTGPLTPWNIENNLGTFAVSKGVDGWSDVVAYTLKSETGGKDTLYFYDPLSYQQIRTVDDVDPDATLGLSKGKVVYTKNRDVMVAYTSQFSLESHNVQMNWFGDIQFLPSISDDQVVWCNIPDYEWGSTTVNVQYKNLATERSFMIAGGDRSTNLWVAIDGHYIVYDPPMQTPEPSTLVMISVAGLGFVVFRWRSRKVNPSLLS